MMTMDEAVAVSEAIGRTLRTDGLAVVATLVARDGHSYRSPGAMMAMTEALEIAGGVSGGCLEEYVGREGRSLLCDRVAAMMRFDTSADRDAPDRPTLSCGGRLDILVERAAQGHVDYLDALIRAMSHSDRAAAVIRVDETPLHASPTVRRTIVDDGRVVFGSEDGGQLAAASDAVELRECISRAAGGVTRTVAYVWPQSRLVVFGARDDAAPLVRVAKAAGWHVTVVDRRARLATKLRFPEADVVIADAWDRAVLQVDWKPWTAAVAMTHSFDDDVELLPLLTRLDVEYLGLLGPSVRTDKLWDAIPAAERGRVRSPVGLSLGDKSPGAIAVAIVAELIAVRRGRRVVGIQASSAGAIP